MGRRYELRSWRTCGDGWASGHGQVVLLGGEPGAGKTRLAAEVAGALHADASRCWWVRPPRTPACPYQPFVAMLDDLFLTSEPGSLTDLVADVRPTCAGCRSTSIAISPLPTPSAEPTDDGRRDLFQAVARLFRRMARDRPLAVVLDDLHWAQLPTIALLEH